MTKVRKVKRRKTFKVNINRKRLRNKMRKLPDIGCADIKEAWENRKSTRHNLGDMGLAYDPNEVLKIPNAKREFLEQAKLNELADSAESQNDREVSSVPSKIHVALALEAEAKAPRERLFKLPNQQVQFVTYLMDKYGDDYKAMARDRKNYYQMTWRQIRAKINSFKGVPEQYAEYLLKKGEIVLEDPTPLEETRKRIAEENVKKFCAPKEKKSKPAKSQWLEDMEDIDFDTADKLEDIADKDAGNSSKKTGEQEKKLQLFSENDSDDEMEDKKSKKKMKKLKAEAATVKNAKAGRTESSQVKCGVKTIKKSDKKREIIEKLPISDSDSEAELEEDDNEEAGFVDLNDLSDEELSEDDILDDSELSTDNDETSD